MAKARWVTPTYVLGQPVAVAEHSHQGDCWRVAQADRPVGRKRSLPHLLNPPKFSHNQTVTFKGGTGRILYHYPDSGSWTYTVEMELGPEPDVGRVGSETMILLHESDIQGVV